MGKFSAKFWLITWILCLFVLLINVLFGIKSWLKLNWNFKFEIKITWNCIAIKMFPCFFSLFNDSNNKINKYFCSMFLIYFKQSIIKYNKSDVGWMDWKGWGRRCFGNEHGGRQGSLSFVTNEYFYMTSATAPNVLRPQLVTCHLKHR